MHRFVKVEENRMILKHHAFSRVLLARWPEWFHLSHDSEHGVAVLNSSWNIRFEVP